MNVDRLHENITNAERLEIIGGYLVEAVLTAPGHTTLRNPDAIVELMTDIRRGEFGGLLREPFLFGIFTTVDGSAVELQSIECLDGHHRLLAGLLSGAWERIEDLPGDAVDTRVNGWRANGSGPEDRWVPLDVVRRSSLGDCEWSTVLEERGAKGATAEISGALSSRDSVFARGDRGVSFRRLARAWQATNMLELRTRIDTLENYFRP